MSIQYHYGKFPPENIDYFVLLELLEKATAALSRFDGVLSGIPNAKLLFGPMVTNEAVLSSKIEGTQATMGEVMEYEASGHTDDLTVKKQNDINEILNYRKAINFVLEQMKTMPLCLRVIKGAHKILLDSVRGQNRAPGEFRKIPNWIGPEGCSIEEATYVPISADKLLDGMGKWEIYLQSDSKSKLIQMAILHAEFEALHPFLDGNGRLGRMLIPLFFTNIGLIQSPMFYISAYFEANKDQYYERLRNVSAAGDWTGWCRFFLEAVIFQANANREQAMKILELYNTKKSLIPDMAKSSYGITALDMLFARPVFTVADIVNSNGLPPATMRRIVKIFKDAGWIIPLKAASGRRSEIMAFPELLNITEGREIFVRKDHAK